MDAARQVALNWAFLMDTLDMTFAELYPLFKAWCDSLPEDKMAGIMATAEALGDCDDTSDSLHTESDDTESDDTEVTVIWGGMDGAPDGLHTESEIWDDLPDAPDGTWLEDVPTPLRPLGPKGPSTN